MPSRKAAHPDVFFPCTETKRQAKRAEINKTCDDQNYGRHAQDNGRQSCQAIREVKDGHQDGREYTDDSIRGFYAPLLRHVLLFQYVKR